jgi:hypothetical protein
LIAAVFLASALYPAKSHKKCIKIQKNEGNCRKCPFNSQNAEKFKNSEKCRIVLKMQA